jgi:hypothetical protein
MDAELVYELIGYAASLLVAISLMMGSILRLRVINLIGALFFSAYGLLIQAYPVAAVNFFIVLIDLYYLVQMLRTKEFFRLLEVQPNSEYLRYFLKYHAADIRKFQPGFDLGEDNLLVFFILRNLVPAGLLIGELREDNRLMVQLDYAIPGFRDLRTGRFVFQDQAQAFRERGVQRIYTQPGAPAHNRYLRQMGFQPETDAQGQQWLCLSLADLP